MKPPPFVYHAPRTIAEVVALLAEHGADARVLAGGQSLIPLMNLRMAKPAVLIDLNRCAELARIERNGAGVAYGAMVRQHDAEHSDVTRTCCPLVAKALACAGPVAVRNRATVGGTLAHADRAAELPGVAIALDATFVLARASGERSVPAEEFFLGDMTTAIEPDEFLKAVVFPVSSTDSHAGFYEVGIRREGVALVGLAAQVVLDERGLVRDARFAVIGVESFPVRLKVVEARVRGRVLGADVIEEAAALASDAVDPMDDAFTKARYRKHVAGSLVRRALQGIATGDRA